MISLSDLIHLKVDERGAERTIRKFKRLCDSYGVVKEYRKREAYLKPSVRNKEKREASEKRRRKQVFRGARTSRL